MQAPARSTSLSNSRKKREAAALSGGAPQKPKAPRSATGASSREAAGAAAAMAVGAAEAVQAVQAVSGAQPEAMDCGSDGDAPLTAQMPRMVKLASSCKSSCCAGRGGSGNARCSIDEQRWLVELREYQGPVRAMPQVSQEEKDAAAHAAFARAAQGAGEANGDYGRVKGQRNMHTVAAAGMLFLDHIEPAKAAIKMGVLWRHGLPARASKRSSAAGASTGVSVTAPMAPAPLERLRELLAEAEEDGALGRRAVRHGAPVAAAAAAATAAAASTASASAAPTAAALASAAPASAPLSSSTASASTASTGSAASASVRWALLCTRSACVQHALRRHSVHAPPSRP